VVCIPVRSVGVDTPWAWAAESMSLFSFIGTSQMPIDSFNTNLWWWYDGDRSIESLRLITTTHQPEAAR